MILRPAITLDDAKRLLAAAEEHARSLKLDVVIAIMDSGARLMALHRMDGARPGNPDIAIGKATTSALTCRPSSVWERWIDEPHPAYATFPVIASGGGVPIIVDGYCVGSVGVSGAKASEDEAIAVAAIRSVFPDARTARTGEDDVLGS
jgi:glc operon protein GlcG